MKFKVRMTHEVVFFMEAESKEAIQNWMEEHTPEEAKEEIKAQREILYPEEASFCVANHIEENYYEGIVCRVRDDSEVNFALPKKSSLDAKAKLLALGPEWYLETVICEYDAFSIHKLKDGTLVYYDHDKIAADFIRERGEITDECYLSVRDDQFLEVKEVERFTPEVYVGMDGKETEALCKKPFDVKGELDDFSALVFWKEV